MFLCFVHLHFTLAFFAFFLCPSLCVSLCCFFFAFSSVHQLFLREHLVNFVSHYLGFFSALVHIMLAQGEFPITFF